MRALDLRLYLVLDPALCGGFEGMIHTAQLAAQNGATVVQLRAPDWKKRQLAECARALKATLDSLGVPLIINDHADVCVAVDAAGLHVGQDDLDVRDARAIIGPDRALGLSVSRLEHVQAVDATLVDHLGVGPIASTTTKPDADAALGIDGFARLCAHKPCPVVAIGSVKAHMAPALCAAGADGLAVVSAICGQADVARATRELRAAVDAARQSCAALSGGCAR